MMHSMQKLAHKKLEHLSEMIWLTDHCQDGRQTVQSQTLPPIPSPATPYWTCSASTRQLPYRTTRHLCHVTHYGRSTARRVSTASPTALLVTVEEPPPQRPNTRLRAVGSASLRYILMALYAMVFLHLLVNLKL
jgi:hypothetical protein